MTDHPSSEELDSDPGRPAGELEALRPFGDEVDDVEGQQLLARLEQALFRRPAKPSTLGRWLILERKGAGAMGVVYAAYDPRLDRRVALKVLRGGRTERQEARARMLREAQALAKISDPHVVHVYDVEELEGNVCVVMELIEGTTLEAWQQEPRSLAEILDRYVAVAHGLAKIHEAGLVHRDVKPSNVLVAGERVVIADFGLVLAEDAVGTDERTPSPGRSPSALELTLTEDGALVGTLGYMAPELLAGAGATAKSDQFAFWVSLYEAVTGVRPFRGTTPRAVAEAIGRRSGPPRNGGAKRGQVGRAHACATPRPAQEP
jgi:eukaryotic-like serine/threonine-protein kinase